MLLHTCKSCIYCTFNISLNTPRSPTRHVLSIRCDAFDEGLSIIHQISAPPSPLGLRKIASFSSPCKNKFTFDLILSNLGTSSCSPQSVVRIENPLSPVMILWVTANSLHIVLVCHLVDFWDRLYVGADGLKCWSAVVRHVEICWWWAERRVKTSLSVKVVHTNIPSIAMFVNWLKTGPHLSSRPPQTSLQSWLIRLVNLFSSIPIGQSFRVKR